MASANDGIVAMAEKVAGTESAFVDLMNQTAQKYGATQTHFMNPHGLDDPEHYTTARDLAKLSAAALQNPTFVEICSTKEKRIDGPEIPRVLINKNKLYTTAFRRAATIMRYWSYVFDCSNFKTSCL